MLPPGRAEHGEFEVRDAGDVSDEHQPTLHHAVDAGLAQLLGRYRLLVDDDPDRATALEPAPDPGFVRVARLVPDGTDGESLTVVLTADGGVSVHVRRTRVLQVAPGARDLEPRLLAVADGLGWSPRS